MSGLRCSQVSVRENCNSPCGLEQKDGKRKKAGFFSHLPSCFRPINGSSHPRCTDYCPPSERTNSPTHISHLASNSLPLHYSHPIFSPLGYCCTPLTCLQCYSLDSQSILLHKADSVNFLKYTWDRVPAADWKYSTHYLPWHRSLPASSVSASPRVSLLAIFPFLVLAENFPTSGPSHLLILPRAFFGVPMPILHPSSPDFLCSPRWTFCNWLVYHYYFLSWYPVLFLYGISLQVSLLYVCFSICLMPHLTVGTMFNKVYTGT